MASDRRRTRPLYVLAAVLTMGAASSALRAETGDLLAEFQSSLGTMPEQQRIDFAAPYWVHEGRSLNSECPGTVPSSLPPCHFQGSRDFNSDGFPDNNCLPGIGCHRSNEHYNSPDPVTTGDTTYNEWLAFDDGNNNGWRSLTIPDSTVPHSPPWGAPFFLNAPPYPVLRVSTGDGNQVAGSLPTSASNFRNSGKAKLRVEYNASSAAAVTLLLKAAAGPRDPSHQFVEVRAFGRRFAFGIGGELPETNPLYGRFTAIDPSSGVVSSTLFSRTVLVAQPGNVGPHAGEFFTFRVVMRSDGTYQAWLDEDATYPASGTSTTTYTGKQELQLTPNVGDETMWFDYVRLFEGELPPACPDPIADLNRDGQVDSADVTQFIACSNGPEVPHLDLTGCRCADRDHDLDLDMADFAVLQRCLTVGGPLNPACDD